MERKHAEMEFSIREKEQTILEKFASVQNRLENGHQSILQVLQFEDTLKELEASLNKEKLIEGRIEILERRLDNYYRINGGECQENGYA